MRICTGIFLFSACVSTFAGATIQCPGNTTFVSIGDSIETVLKTCGKPKFVREKQVQSLAKKDNPKTRIRWYYTSMYQDQGGINTGIVTFGPSGNVANLSSGQTMRCSNGNIKVGDSMATVSRLCGPPQTQATDQQLQKTLGWNGQGYRYNNEALGGDDIQTLPKRFNPYAKNTVQQNPDKTQAQSKPVKGSIAILTYQPHDYMPKTAFIFINNKLVQVGHGVLNQ